MSYKVLDQYRARCQKQLWNMNESWFLTLDSDGRDRRRDSAVIGFVFFHISLFISIPRAAFTGASTTCMEFSTAQYRNRDFKICKKI